MEKTPAQVKKGLECIANGRNDIDECEVCFSMTCAKQTAKDAGTYIRQLEAQNAELVRKTEQLERERDAAVEDIRRGSRCSACKMFFHNGGRCSGGIYCVPMDFEWRGVQEPPKEDT